MKKIGLLFLFLIQLSCSGQENKKVNGISFVSSREEVTQKAINPVLEVNASHAAVMPFGFIRDVNSPEIIFNTQRQWYGETRSGARQYITMLHENGIAVMVKPQIWIWRGIFTGHLKMEAEEDWKKLETSYENFILVYARLAEETESEYFCIGTELEQFTKNRPEFWTKLISKIKSVYSGKLTYAANWDEFTRTPFWGELDYIGIDAYFPLSEEKTPSLSQLQAGWQPHKEKIEQLSRTLKKPVLFTEFGYRSTDYTAKKPWLADRNNVAVNFDAQSNATKALFEEFWKEDWFAGGFIWKWFIHHENAGGLNDNRFTPQNKPVEKVIRDHYKLF